MENELDLTLRLALPNPTAETHSSLNTPTSNQGIKVDGDNNDVNGNFSLRRLLMGDDVEIDDDEGARNNVNVNLRVYNYIFQYFAGIGVTLNFAPYPMPPSPSPAPAPVTPTLSDYVTIDVPARRTQRNNSLAIENALDANANAKRRRDCGGCCGGRIDRPKKCTNMNCNAINTPMWRRGPLGPKSLCNACGIKFRKEEERRSKSN